MKILKVSELSNEDERSFNLHNKLSITEQVQVIDLFGSSYFFKNGTLHKEDGPAVIHPTGTRMWFKNGLLHREGGPAVEYHDGSCIFYIEGKKERHDGPAYIDGNLRMWFINDKHISKEEARLLIENKKNTEKLSKVIALLKLKYCDAVR